MACRISSSIPDAPMDNVRVLSLELPEDRHCRHPVQAGGCFCSVRTGGETLKGVCAIEMGSSHCQVVDICFEGICRTWLPDTTTGDLHVNDHHFLQQVQNIKVRPAPSNATPARPSIQLKHFEFRIPARIPVTIPSGTPYPANLTRELYPSMRLGRVYFEKVTGKVFAQPFIMYKLSASIRTKHTPYEHQPDLSRQIKIIPTAICPPPTDISAFTDEYVPEARFKIRNLPLSQSVGSVELRAEEPQALCLPETFSKTTTTVSLKLLFQPADISTGSQVAPYRWKFKIRSRLQRRTFWATKPSDKIPTILDSRRSSLLGMRTIILHTATSKYGNITWRNNHTSACGTIVTAEETTDPWVATIQVPITADHNLVPSFFSPTAWLRYSVLLDVHISGTWFSHATLAIPVQVINPPRLIPKSGNEERDLPPSICTPEDIMEGIEAGSGDELPGYRRVPF